MLIWVRDEANCFCATGWTEQISLKLLVKLAFARSVEAWRWTAASTVIKCTVTRCVAGKDASQPDACWAGSRREPRKGMRTWCAKRRLSAFSVRGMGGAKRYPSIGDASAMMGFAALYPSYALPR
jgi:hypothetical protein